MMASNPYLGLDPERKKAFDKVQSHEKPSQIPVIVTRESYQRALAHGKMEGGIWGCMLSGARFQARMVMRNVYDSNSQLVDRSPVAELYCSGCEKPPTTPAEAAVWSADLTTVSM
jgi:hypothetical protein